MGEIKILGLCGRNVQKVNQGTKMISFGDDPLIPFILKKFPWDLTFKIAPYNALRIRQTETYRGSFIKKSGKTINYTMTIKPFSNNDSYSMEILTKTADNIPVTTSCLISSKQDPVFNLEFNFNPDVNDEYLTMVPFAYEEQFPDLMNEIRHS